MPVSQFENVLENVEIKLSRKQFSHIYKNKSICLFMTSEQNSTVKLGPNPTPPPHSLAYSATMLRRGKTFQQNLHHTTSNINHKQLKYSITTTAIDIELLEASTIHQFT